MTTPGETPDMSGVDVSSKLIDVLLALELDDHVLARRLVRESIETIRESAVELRDLTSEFYSLTERIRVERDEAQAQVEKLRQALTDYAEHLAWRCAYRSRYEKCMCGLDDLMTELGLPIVEVQDPEAKKEP